MLVNIEAERARLQLTKSEISKRLGITGATYYNYINGIRPMPSSILLKMADMFGCSTDYLLGLSESRRNAASDKSRARRDATRPQYAED